VALNRFRLDDAAEIAAVAGWCEQNGIPFALSEHHQKGGEGALDLARLVVAQGAEPTRPFEPLYRWEDRIEDKIGAVATKMYGAGSVVYTTQARRALGEAQRLGLDKLPVCVAKTQSSLSDDPLKTGRPRGFELTVRDAHISAGAGFLVVMTGEILRMPGLPKNPAAEQIDVVDGRIVGLR
jgi:formate--tetrahydrofolate ligase